MRRRAAVRGQHAAEPSCDGARLSRAVADHDRDARLGARRRSDRGRDFGRRPRACSPNRCRRCCSPLPSPVQPGPWRAFAITPVARISAGTSPMRRSHPSVGAVVTLAALFGIVGSAAVLTTIIVVYGGYREGARQVASAVAALAADAFDGAPDQLTAREFADALVRFGPPAIAASTLMMLCVNLYAAARSTQLSRNLPRPWPRSADIAFPALAAGRRISRLSRGLLCAAQPCRPDFSVGAGGSAALWRCRGWRSRMRCRVVSR